VPRGHRIKQRHEKMEYGGDKIFLALRKFRLEETPLSERDDVQNLSHK
jgi:hypothetical protein